MNLFEYLLACTFWQWVGTIMLVGAMCQAIYGTLATIASKVRNP
ncbi:MAG: hypothetical protein JW384_01617 [Nitrosomonadaceae bacterium]|nr:hypothetical protein [Nitrosomonadaceae bacterium]